MTAVLFSVFDMIVDVRSREEFIKEHIKGAYNFPLQDLEYYLDFLRDQSIELFCDTGFRSRIAKDYLQKNGITAEIIPMSKYGEYKMIQRSVVCALNYLTVKPGKEQAFTDLAGDLCHKTVEKKGFLGSKIFRISSISFGGSMVQGPYEEVPIKPTKYVMLTYWTSKEAHEKFHEDPEILEGFGKLMPLLSSMPFEEFGDIIR